MNTPISALSRGSSRWRESAARTRMAPAPLHAVLAHSPQLWPRGLCGQKSREGKGRPSERDLTTGGGKGFVADLVRMGRGVRAREGTFPTGDP